jgi:predicted acyl esterase
MSKYKLIKYFYFLFAPFMFTFPAFSQTSLNAVYPVMRTDFNLTLSDGVILDCSEFTPETAQTGGLPAVIFLHGFGGSKNEVNPFAENLAKYGYCTFSYSMRGQGKSTGLSNLISTTEMKDLMQVIEFVKSKQEINPDRIALIGSSQGGILAFMAACNGSEARCIVADLASPEFASSWIENGCVKMTLLWSLNYDSTIVRYSPEAKNFKRWILSGRKDKWDSLATYLPIDRDFVSSLDEMNVPMLASNSWQDKFFNTNGMIKASSVINAPFRMYFGAIGGHGSDTAAAETYFHSKNIEDWLNYWLYDVNNTIHDLSKFTYATSSHPIEFNHWTYSRSYSDTWPPEGTVNLRLYFSPGNKLTIQPHREQTDTVSFLNDVRDKSLKLRDAVKSGFTGDEFNSKFVKTLIYFETEPLENNILLTGTPMLNLVYASTANICQYNFQIWEVKPNGEMNFVTRINYTDRHYLRNFVTQKWLNGISHSHLFQKGYKIRIYVTNIDNGPADNFLETNPHVLPVLKRARNYIFMGKESPTYIELPVIYK